MTTDAYAFIYDDFVSDRKYERELAAIEARLAMLDVSGRVGKLTLFRSAKDLIQNMVRQGVGTVVLVGNDHTLDKAMWFLPDLGCTVGYIPITGPSRVAELLGIPVGPAACDVLAARLMESVDIGRIDDRYFLTELALERTSAVIEVDGRFTISPVVGGSVFIRNLGSNREGMPESDARDGLLELVIRPRPEPVGRFRRPKPIAETSLFMQTGEITSADPVDVVADNHVVNGFRFTVGIEPRKLRIITGRGRRLSGRGLQ